MNAVRTLALNTYIKSYYYRSWCYSFFYRYLQLLLQPDSYSYSKPDRYSTEVLCLFTDAQGHYRKNAGRE